MSRLERCVWFGWV